MSENIENKGITIKELKVFLSRLPEEFDDYGLVNGEVVGFDEYYVRVDNPIIHLELDENTKELLMLHQSESELEEILKEIEKNGDSKRTEE
jgi:hypothetical protein